MRWFRPKSHRTTASTGTEYARRIAQLSRDDEVALINHILRAGYDQGCFLRVDPVALLAHNPADSYEIFDAVRERASLAPTEADPFGDDGLPVGEIPGQASGWIVITQRCDLVRSLHDEPFVELVHAVFETDADLVQSARRNSGRFLFVAAGTGGAWVADLRHRALIAKDQLPATPALNPVPAGTDRRRLKLRIGQRYSRDALPTDLVETVQRPILKVLRKGGPRKASELFSEWLVFRSDTAEKAVVQAVFDSLTTSQKAADDAYNEIEKAFGEELLQRVDENDSGAVALQRISLWRYFYGYKMDLDEVSYGSKASSQAVKPTL